MGSPKKPTPQQSQALKAVAEGRVEWGNEYQKMARTRGITGDPIFIIDGVGVYGGQRNTFSRLSELGWIRERVDLLPTKVMPAEIRTEKGLSQKRVVEIPERKVPADDGWRAKVELTDTGRAALSASTSEKQRD